MADKLRVGAATINSVIFLQPWPLRRASFMRMLGSYAA